jgi:glycosyltransferase involved in cell wall biosynthesis
MVNKRVAINQPRASYYVGGAEMVALEHAKSLFRLGYTVEFITISPQSTGSSYSKQYSETKKNFPGIQFVELQQESKALPWYSIDPGENRDRWNVESLYYNRPLYDYLNKGTHSKDVLLSYYKLDALVVPKNKVSINALYLCGIPKRENEFMSSFLSVYDRIAAITDETRAYWQPYTATAINVTPTGVDRERFKPSKVHHNILHVVFMGRLIERKGCDILLKAIGKLPHSDISRLRVIIVGDGPQRSKLKSLARELKVEKIVQFVGVVDNPEDIFGDADICVFPSRYGEGLQGVILEAMASGSLVIATDTPVNKKLLANNRGIIIPSEDISSIAKAIGHILRNESSRIESSRKARNYVSVAYDWDRLTHQLIEAFK